MKTMLGVAVYRSGESASKWNHETDNVAVGKLGNRDSLAFQFKVASAGGGVTDVQLELSPFAFDRLLNEMYKIAPEKVAALMARQMNQHFWPDSVS